MKLGLIGYPLGHSKSPEIHKYLTGADYSLWPLKPEELDAFFTARDFDGINVTIPYKLDVIKYLDGLDPAAERIGAVNTIVNRGGKLTGYNTDCLGLKMLIEDLWAIVSLAGGPEPSGFDGTHAAILGSGGAARAAVEAVKQLGGIPVIVSRDPKDSDAIQGSLVLSYEELYSHADEFTLLINATPLGMSPKIDGLPADLDRLPQLKAVVDVVANPMCTRLAFEARERGIMVAGGLKMLVAQAIAAEELFTDSRLDPGLLGPCMDHIAAKSRNIVLIGMPSSGKTTIGRLLAKKLGKDLIDMDEILTARIGMPIAEYFAKHGEQAFRKEESKLAAELALAEGKIISTGGGIVKDRENMRYLGANGDIVWLDRSLALLAGTPDRPLSQNAADMERLYKERMPLYEKYADLRICADSAPEEIAETIIKIIYML